MPTKNHSLFLSALCVVLAAACGQPSDDGAVCAPGEEACACTPAQPCGEGMVCVDQQCQQPGELDLIVSDPAARSCELLVRAAGARVVGATFGPSVTGVHLREGDRSAVSFFANDDAAISSGAISLQVVVPAPAAAGVEIVTTRCFDRDGRELAGATVRAGGEV